LIEAVDDLAHRIHAEFTYQANVTTIDTPLLDTLKARRGVCQDFSHVMIGALRSLGLAARYVSGYLRSGADYQGAEASHAWVSVYLPGAGWIDTVSGGPQLAYQLATRQSTAVASYSDGTYVVIWCQTAGETITVPQVSKTPEATGTTGAESTDVTVAVSKSGEALTVRDGDDKVLLFAPVTVGSERDPLPIGQWKVKGVQRDPVFSYNPDLFWDADPSHMKAKIPAGPNNPVGAVWIDLDKPHYGLHGTPEPGKIGYRESHGCVRLTNWDALKLAALVKPGTVVRFEP